jgi:hypothetical protein
MNDKSMADKVKELGFDAESFKRDIFELDDIITNKCFTSQDYGRENLEKNVYPKLRELKKRYNIDIPLGMCGIDMPRLDSRLDSALEMKK